MNQTLNPIVQLNSVTKTYDDVVAVADLDVKIASGEFVTLLGPSGCGKSTILRTIGGFARPTSGRVILDGKDITDLPPHKRALNMVFQDYALFPHMSVERNIAFGLELNGYGKKQIPERITALLDFLQLGEFRHRMPDQLSGGQKQRVALARALAPDPKILLLDEPLGALDAKLRGQVQVELKTIQKTMSKTFLFVTHDQEEALTMSDRIIVMNKGRIEQDGTPEDLYFRPTSRFVADFIGETNLITCRVKGVDAAEIVLDWHGHEVRAHTQDGYSPDNGQKVEAAIRPESIICSPTPPADGKAHEGRVLRTIFKGSTTVLDIALGDNDNAVIQASVRPDLAAALVDDKAWVQWNADRMSILHN